MSRSILIFVLFALLGIGSFYAFKTQPQELPEVKLNSPSTSMEEALNAFVASLDEKQKEKALFAFTDAVRENWSFLPGTRAGLTLKEMTELQQELALKLVQTGLSETGYEKMNQIRGLEDVLTVLEKRKPNNDWRNPMLYYMAIFGHPAKDKIWGWRFEGHHVSLNYSSIDQKMTVVPSFLGTNPAEVRSGAQKGLRILGEEEDKGRAIVKSLDEAQFAQAHISEQTFGEIVTAGKAQVRLATFEGLPYSKMNSMQQAKIVDLIQFYLTRLTKEAATALWTKTQAAGLDKLHFAWAGGVELGDKQYYRIHGPTLLIEYDNSQNEGNHAHSIIRDIEDDFGHDYLLQHYEQDHKH